MSHWYLFYRKPIRIHVNKHVHAYVITGLERIHFLLEAKRSTAKEINLIVRRHCKGEVCAARSIRIGVGGVVFERLRL